MDKLLVFYNWGLWLICFLVSYNFYIKGSSVEIKSIKFKKTLRYFFILVLCYSLYTHFGGDKDEYRDFVESTYNDLLFYNSIGATTTYEMFYVMLAKFCGGNLLVWKFFVYGIAIIFNCIVIRRYGLNNSAILLFTIFPLISYGSTRAVLAYAVFLSGYLLLFDAAIKQRLLGICFLCLSYYLHSSMVLPIVLSLFSLVPTKRGTTWIIIMIIGIPVSLLILNSTMGYLMADENIMASHLGGKLYTYINIEGGGGSHSMLTTIYQLLNYSMIGIALLLTYKCYRKGLLNKHFEHLYKFCLMLAYGSLIVLFSGIGGYYIIFQRYFTMVPFFIWLIPASIDITYLKSETLFLSLVIIGLVKGMVFFFMSYYYA